MTFIYLGSPYSHPVESVRLARFEYAASACAVMVRHSVPVYCPIVHWHPVAERHGLPGDHEFWRLQDRVMMELCTAAWFLAIPGWRESRGMEEEIAFLKQRGIPIDFAYPETIEAQCRKWVSARSLSNVPCTPG